MSSKSITTQPWLGLHALALGSALFAMPLMEAAAADVALPPISVGAGMRTSFARTNYDDVDYTTDDFSLDSIRLYVNGAVTDTIKFTFNTEYNGSELILMDAIARLEVSDMFNIWAGRFLPPSDRANLYGPYYANNWAVYNDGVQDGYPSIAVGRDNGLAYWGQFGILKISAGFFDVPSTLGYSSVLSAARAQVDLWDPEPGYYLNGTYYGEKDILAFGVAAQKQGGDNAYSIDFLLEKKLGGAGAFTVEGEYTNYDGVGGYDGLYNKSDGSYGLVSYLFPQEVGIGKFQLLAKYAKADFDDRVTASVVPTYDQKTKEVDFNYIIKSFNARVSLFYVDTDYSDGPGFKKYGLGIQLQM